MNYSTYIFGVLSSGYSQYPDDSCSELYQRIFQECTATSQIIIHRDGNLMYYVYLRKINKKRHIGLAVIINGYFLSKINLLFSIFEKGIEKLVEKGVIISFTKDGELTSTLSSLWEEKGESWLFINWLRHRFDSVQLGEKRLPPLDYGISIESRTFFSLADNNSEIVKASYRFGFTFVLKETDFDTIRLTTFKNILKNLNADKEKLITENTELRRRNEIIKVHHSFEWGWKTWTLFCFLMALILTTAFFIFSNPQLKSQFQYTIEKYIP